ncbi:cupin domain-containing protein [Pseudoflavitalea sp. X16]|uniref:carboxymuconolactone decarboxylase family protein n=1 Tax=Paraflavitalea devenefica TaxID=2716334 RepID=UPI0014246C79|nr:carboxymuconolactone decarboxylase family protein [Paraflavitalea devenefica]NII28388.1 cupin domain-containing protein [Paraflavitalea devenefica]
MRQKQVVITLLIAFSLLSLVLKAQTIPKGNRVLNPKEQSLIKIAASTAKGNLSKLRSELNTALDAGLTVNQIKEAIVHIYAYAGFPRSLRGLQTFMAVLDDRKSKGIVDATGPEASPINNDSSKYNRGKAVLEKLTGVPETGPKTGYAAFAPTIEIFLKEHLFADIFERDVLTYAERELITVSVLSSIGGVEPMLQSHLKICLNVGLTVDQLHQFTTVIQSAVGDREAIAAQKVLDEILNGKQKVQHVDTAKTDMDMVFPKGEKVTNNNFTGQVWVNYLLATDTVHNVNIGSVTFEPGARTNWHYHKGGQILLVTGGRGLYQEKGKPVEVIERGEVIKCPPNKEHWHGATPTESMTHISIGTNVNIGGAVWLKPVTDEEYHRGQKH